MPRDDLNRPGNRPVIVVPRMEGFDHSVSSNATGSFPLRGFFRFVRAVVSLAALAFLCADYYLQLYMMNWLSRDTEQVVIALQHEGKHANTVQLYTGTVPKRVSDAWTLAYLIFAMFVLLLQTSSEVLTPRFGREDTMALLTITDGAYYGIHFVEVVGTVGVAYLVAVILPSVSLRLCAAILLTQFSFPAVMIKLLWNGRRDPDEKPKRKSWLRSCVENALLAVQIVGVPVLFAVLPEEAHGISPTFVLAVNLVISFVHWDHYVPHMSENYRNSLEKAKTTKEWVIRSLWKLKQAKILMRGIDHQIICLLRTFTFLPTACYLLGYNPMDYYKNRHKMEHVVYHTKEDFHRVTDHDLIPQSLPISYMLFKAIVCALSAVTLHAAATKFLKTIVAARVNFVLVTNGALLATCLGAYFYCKNQIYFAVVMLEGIFSGDGLQENTMSLRCRGGCMEGHSSKDIFYLVYVAVLFVSSVWISWLNGEGADEIEPTFWRWRSRHVGDGLLPMTAMANGFSEIAEKIENKQEVVKKPMVFACVTMWNEEQFEIVGLIRSLMGLDIYVAETDAFDLESHIILDQAYDENDEMSERVEMLVSLIETMCHPHDCELRWADVPYGRFFTVTLPNKCELFVHLKNTNIVKRRKRWSQNMYLQYLCKFRFSKFRANDCDDVQETAAIRRHLMRRTFILTLDADIQFHPLSVARLVTTLHERPGLAAVCGRIIPVGSGLVAGYQKFEYALGHWMQKSVEAAIGPVMCAPGCFSLFSVRCLADSGILDVYAKNPELPDQVIQWDLGEDRWLTTLIVQQGGTIDYVPEAEAYTNCPNSFEEFCKQRRRWVPSTLLNTKDLLFDRKYLMDTSIMISGMCRWYHRFQVGFTLLMPAFSLFVLTLGYHHFFNLIIGSYYASVPLSILPVAAPHAYFVRYVSRHRLTDSISRARDLSSIGSVNVLVFLAGFVHNLYAFDTSIEFFICAFALVLLLIAAAVNTCEFGNFSWIFLYMLAIPTYHVNLYLITIYNMNDTSWGTRETTSESERYGPFEPNSGRVHTPPKEEKVKVKKKAEAAAADDLPNVPDHEPGANGSDNDADNEPRRQTPEEAAAAGKSLADYFYEEAARKYPMIDDVWAGGSQVFLSAHAVVFHEHLVEKIIGVIKKTKEEEASMRRQLAESRDYYFRRFVGFNVLAYVILAVIKFSTEDIGLDYLDVSVEPPIRRYDSVFNIIFTGLMMFFSAFSGVMILGMQASNLMRWRLTQPVYVAMRKAEGPANRFTYKRGDENGLGGMDAAWRENNSFVEKLLQYESQLEALGSMKAGPKTANLSLKEWRVARTYMRDMRRMLKNQGEPIFTPESGY